LLSTATAANTSPLLDRKIEETTAGLPASYTKHLRSIGEGNAVTIIEYIVAMKSDVNLSDNYRQDLIEALARFSKYNDNKPLKNLTRTNIIAFLETLCKTETQDPMHKWISTSLAG
jgi:integrase/recombinase XerD